VSTLILIRHGQASFGAADYDVLSDRGVEQARILGQHLAARDLSVDAVYSGPAKRQRDTATHLLAAATEAGHALPGSSVVPELDEYPAFELFKRFLPVLREKDPEIAELMTGLDSSASYRKVYARVSQKWARGEFDTEDLESFAQFESRVHSGLDHIMKREGRGKTVLAVTSGGPISLSVRRALQLAPEVALKVAWVVANASMTEYRFSDDDFTLIGFNRIPHLQDPLITYV